MDTPHTDDRTTTPPQGDEMKQGISNRETSAQEEMERKEHPPLADEDPQSGPHRARGKEKQPR